MMRELADEGMTMIVVTHEMGFARDVGDQVVFMDEGVVVEQGEPHAVLDNPRRSAPSASSGWSWSTEPGRRAGSRRTPRPCRPGPAMAPAIAGRMTTVSSSETEVSNARRATTSSSLR